jgi:hypothetical protein
VDPYKAGGLAARKRPDCVRIRGGGHQGSGDRCDKGVKEWMEASVFWVALLHRTDFVTPANAHIGLGPGSFSRNMLGLSQVRG